MAISALGTFASEEESLANLLSLKACISASHCDHLAPDRRCGIDLSCMILNETAKVQPSAVIRWSTLA